MCVGELSDEDITEAAAEGARVGKERSSAEDHAKKELKERWKAFLNSEECLKIIDRAVDIAKERWTHGDNAATAIGVVAKYLFEPLLELLNEMKKCSPETLSIVKGLLFSLCSVIAAKAVISLKWANFTKEKLCAAFRGVWRTIKEVTGFVWEKFVELVKDPLFWTSLASVIGSGIGTAVVATNPLFGAFLIGASSAFGVGVAVGMRK